MVGGLDHFTSYVQETRLFYNTERNLLHVVVKISCLTIYTQIPVTVVDRETNTLELKCENSSHQKIIDSIMDLRNYRLRKLK